MNFYPVPVEFYAVSDEAPPPLSLFQLKGWNFSEPLRYHAAAAAVATGEHLKLQPLYLSSINRYPGRLGGDDDFAIFFCEASGTTWIHADCFRSDASAEDCATPFVPFSTPLTRGEVVEALRRKIPILWRNRTPDAPTAELVLPGHLDTSCKPVPFSPPNAPRLCDCDPGGTGCHQADCPTGKEEREEHKRLNEEAIPLCPECGNEMVQHTRDLPRGGTTVWWSCEDKTHAPRCPHCSEQAPPMVLRRAREGLYAGRFFWGCSLYPVCNATRPFHIPPTTAASPACETEAVKKKKKWKDLSVCKLWHAAEPQHRERLLASREQVEEYIEYMEERDRWKWTGEVTLFGTVLCRADGSPWLRSEFEARPEGKPEACPEETRSVTPGNEAGPGISDGGTTIRDRLIAERWKTPLFEPKYCKRCGHSRGCMHPRRS